MAPSDFHDFFEVVTGHYKNAVNQAGGHVLSSVFFLISFLCSLPSSLLGADPFPRRTAIPGGSEGWVRDRHSWTEPLRLAGGQFLFLSSIFSLLSSVICVEHLRPAGGHLFSSLFLLSLFSVLFFFPARGQSFSVPYRYSRTGATARAIPPFWDRTFAS